MIVANSMRGQEFEKFPFTLGVMSMPGDLESELLGPKSCILSHPGETKMVFADPDFVHFTSRTFSKFRCSTHIELDRDGIFSNIYVVVVAIEFRSYE
jgi:hypothetical protein